MCVTQTGVCVCVRERQAKLDVGESLQRIPASSLVAAGGSCQETGVCQRLLVIFV